MATPRKLTPEQRIMRFRAIVHNHQYAKIDGVRIDATSANMVVKVYEALNDENKAKYARLDAFKMVMIGWKLVK